MSDDKLIPPPNIEGGEPPIAMYDGYRDHPAGFWDDPYLQSQDPDALGLDLRRYLLALLRYKWLLLGALLLGAGGAYYAWNSLEVTYTAEGNLWLETDGRGGGGDVGPIRPSELFGGAAWIELLRSYQVLEPVVHQERLWLRAPDEHALAFTSFGLTEPFAPGTYELRVGEIGEDYVLVTADGQPVQRGLLGTPIGEGIGFVWKPAKGSFEPGATVRFSVLGVRDAASDLGEQVQTTLDRQGNFIRLRLSGTNPEKIADVVNALMERHRDLAADLKRGQLDERLVILEAQLDTVELALARAERELEEFRVATISLPSDRTIPIAPGLEYTRDPVYGDLFRNQVAVSELRRDRARLESVLEELSEGSVRIDRLEMIEAAAGSTELRSLLENLVDLRAELRVQRARYADDYPPMQELIGRINTLETGAIPGLVRDLVDGLASSEREAQLYVEQAAASLQEIPPRTIEEGRLRRRVETTVTLYNEIRGRVETARLAAASSIPDVRILDPASPPQTPSGDNRFRVAAAILFGCLGAAIGGALLLDRVDARFRYAADVGRKLGLDVLGGVPRIETYRGRRGVVNAAQALEAFRELRIHVGFAFGKAGPITLTITSPSAGEGKSLISSNLAVAFAEVGKRTLLIDGDTRRGDAHRLLGRERSPGLVDYLKERSSDDIIQATDHANLDFIGSGSRGVSSPELLASPRMAYFMGTLKRSYDVIIVDGPPLASGGDPLILGSLTGNLAVVIRAGATEKGLAQAKLDQLSRLPLRVLGAIINDVSRADKYASYLPGYEPFSEEDEDVDHRGVSLLSERRPSA